MGRVEVDVAARGETVRRRFVPSSLLIMGGVTGTCPYGEGRIMGRVEVDVAARVAARGETVRRRFVPSSLLVMGG
jgi:hypothetical protein